MQLLECTQFERDTMERNMYKMMITPRISKVNGKRKRLRIIDIDFLDYVRTTEEEADDDDDDRQSKRRSTRQLI